MNRRSDRGATRSGMRRLLVDGTIRAMRNPALPSFLLLVSVVTPAPAGEKDEFFEARVRPLLAKRCFECHRRQAEGGLRLDSRQAILRGGGLGPAIVPGDSTGSLLMQVVRREHADVAMPPETPLLAGEVKILERWIDEGAVWPDALPSARATPDEHGITDEERSFWSFQPIRRPDPPDVGGEWGEHPIDAFVARKHRQHGLIAGSTLPPRRLLRRLSFDLVGLPPTPRELELFESRWDEDPQHALNREIDRLLESPHYGERWGQHWLDLVRYADTAGDASDFPIPEAYKYRNYVIDAFNRDKPYDQFVREQIAGDLLPADDGDETWRRTIATGYLAVSRRVGVSPQNQPHITIEDTLDNLGKTFLGLTLGCARCHDHKFDPIPTSDYYALYGIFNSSVYPHPGAEHLPYRRDFVYRVGTERAAEVLADDREKLDVLRKREREAFEQYRDLQRKPEEELGYTRDEAWRKVLDRREELARFAVTVPFLETAYAVSEGDPEDACIQEQGDPKEPGVRVRRGFLQILGGRSLPDDVSGSGRLQLAQWISSSDNPLAARVMANRVWHHHFGRGIVATTSDFGVRGARPSHSELLDYLASYLIDNDWSLKKLHRLIMTSRTWQLASHDVSSSSAIDPDNVYLWRGHRRRLDAEQFRDAVLAVSGQLDRSRGEAHPFPHRLTYFYRQHEPFVGDFASKRRSVYLFRQRIRKNAYLDLFDGPDGNVHLGVRRPTTTSLQALYLMNSDFVEEQSRATARRVVAGGTTEESRIQLAYEHLYGRPPTDDEFRRAVAQMAQLEDSAGGDSDDAWTSMVRAMLCSNEFLYID